MKLYGKEKKMTREEKQILLVDLCARLPYGVNVKTTGDNESYTLLSINSNKNIALIGLDFGGVYATSKIKIDEVKAYLRPMSSMTEEEKEYYYTFIDEFSIDNRYPQFTAKYVNKKLVDEYIDWLNAHHFDFRNLIERGLAISTVEFNPYEK